MKGREVIAAPQVAHCQLPVVFGFSVVTGAPSPSSGIGSDEGVSKSAKSGTSRSSRVDAPRVEVSAGASFWYELPPPPAGSLLLA